MDNGGIELWHELVSASNCNGIKESLHEFLRITELHKSELFRIRVIRLIVDGLTGIRVEINWISKLEGLLHELLRII